MSDTKFAHMYVNMKEHFDDIKNMLEGLYYQASMTPNDEATIELIEDISNIGRSALKTQKAFVVNYARDDIKNSLLNEINMNEMMIENNLLNTNSKVA